MGIKFGDKVKCIITGFEGMVTARTEYINGCIKYGVEPPVNEKGEMREAFSIDEENLVIIQKNVIDKNKSKAKKVRKGGPTVKVLRKAI